MRNRHSLTAFIGIVLAAGFCGVAAAQQSASATAVQPVSQSVSQAQTNPPVQSASQPITDGQSSDGQAGSQASDSPPMADIASSTGTSSPYRIGVDDIITISVWHEPDLSRNVPVRPDGKISLPLVGDVQAAGKTAMGLQAELKTDLAKFVKDPELTVIVSDIRSRRINVIGQVNRPGAYSLTQSMGVVDAIAAASGLRDFAKTNDIYVLRETADGKRLRLTFDYRNVIKGKKGAQDIMLQPRDTVVIP
jgi:polysaccharide export outer membrane protein